MTDRELSEKLSELAGKIVSYLENVEGRPPTVIWSHLMGVAKELKQLSNEKYTPGSIDWDDVRKQTHQQGGRKRPF